MSNMPTKMDDHDLIAYINLLIDDSAIKKAGVAEACDTIDDLYEKVDADDVDPNGSSAHATDVQDIILSDMPPLENAFGGAADIVTFRPADSANEKQVKEASEKTAYCHHVYSLAPFRPKVDFLQNVLRYPVAAIQHEFVTQKKVRVRTHHDIPADEWELMLENLRADYGTQMEFEEKRRYIYDGSDVSAERFLELTAIGEPVETVVDGKITITRKETKFLLEAINPRNFIVSANATNPGDAMIIGKMVEYTRGALVEMGFKKNKIAEIPSGNLDSENYRNQTTGSGACWAAEIVCGFEGQILVDADGDGKLERREILKFGNILLKNEEVDLCDEAVPYSYCSAYLNPGRVVGLSRAQLVADDQLQKTELLRALLDNTAAVGRGKTMIDLGFIKDPNDLTTSENGGYIDVDTLDPDTNQRIPIGNIAQSLPVPAVTEQVIVTAQAIETSQSRRTGLQVSTQGVKADVLHKETATRFEGVKDESQAKMTHVMRNIANLVFVPMFNSIVYQAQKYTGTARSIRVAGEDTNVNPGAWSFDSYCEAVVGEEGTKVENLSTILAMSQQLAATGYETLVTPDKVFKQVEALSKAMGIYNTNDFFNDPTVPADQLMAENMQLKQQLQMLQEQVSGLEPLQNAEKNKMAIEMAKLTDKQLERGQNLALELTKLETETGKQLDAKFNANEKTAMGDGSGRAAQQSSVQPDYAGI